MSALDKFIENLNSVLPDICTDRDLTNILPEIFKNHCALTRMRSRGEAPEHFHIHPNIYYLKEDVISWLKKKYHKT